jgi:hypothetical protein
LTILLTITNEQRLNDCIKSLKFSLNDEIWNITQPREELDGFDILTFELNPKIHKEIGGF